MYSFGIFSFLSLAIAELYFTLGVIILFKNYKNAANKLFFLMALTMAVWGLAEGMMRAAQNYGTAFFWAKYVLGFGATLHFAFLLHFWLAFSGQITTFKKRLPIAVIYIPSIIFLALRLFTNTLLKGVVQQYWGFTIEGTQLYLLYMLYIAICTGLTVFLALKSSFALSGSAKKQARNIAFGVLFALVAGIFTQISRPIVHMQLPEMTVISTLIFIVIVAEAVSKEKMLTITAKVAAENILATMEDFIIVVNDQMKIVLINDSLLRNLGYSSPDLLEEPLSKILISEISSSSFDMSLPKFPLLDLQAELQEKTGEKIPVYINATVLKDEFLAPSGFVFVLRDWRKTNDLITNLQNKSNDLEQSEQSLEANNRELRHVNEMMVDRELKMIELKKKIQELEAATKVK